MSPMARGKGREKSSAVGDALRAMFKSLENRPTPDRLRSVIDQLDEGEAETPRKASDRRQA
jgi:hypothetical protein